MITKKRALEIIERNNLEYEILWETPDMVQHWDKRLLIQKIEVFLPETCDITSIICSDWSDVIARLRDDHNIC